MPKLNFKLSDNQKHDALWTLLNANYNEESDWIIDYAICDIHDEYALVYNYGEAIYEKVYYTKDEETDIISINNQNKIFTIDVTEEEFNALDIDSDYIYEDDDK